MEQHVFVDESKARNFLLIASVMLPAGVTAARRDVRALVLPGQRRIHMKTESDARRRVLLSKFEEFGFTATIFRAGAAHKRELDRREACLRQLVAQLAGGGDTILCLESDETLDDRDRRQLYGFARDAGCAERLRYHHARAAQEPLLAVPDVIGWAWAKGGDWRRRTDGLVVDVIEV